MKGSRVVRVVFLVALVTAGCSRGSPEDITAPAPTVPPSVPLDSRIVQVMGTLNDAGRQQVIDQAGSTVEAWFDNAFLKPTYPVTSFPDAFSSFSAGAAALAAQHADVMSNAGIGADIQGTLVAKVKESWFTVLARADEPHAATGAVVLEVAGRHASGEVTVRVTGDVYLTRTGGAWQIIGYRILNESTVPDAGTTVTSAAGGTTG